jgi:hypothetical protein
VTGSEQRHQQSLAVTTPHSRRWQNRLCQPFHLLSRGSMSTEELMAGGAGFEPRLPAGENASPAMPRLQSPTFSSVAGPARHRVRRTTALL